ncbi:MAG: aminopeptidase P family protein [Candidatus Omnitrophica bacterium]|nr:aminopeptidase P family protein [Candidatus Omnitrophota bacterium]MDE2009989.1 aminopeptidase P family protein [Candidatus Omnitrophota bacterium]MDE2215326.1 aminopeptidase P family protein [Candidatus Omnitrophota bacterium]MDE2231722.1 aminopeptidase P family protein [Candidatus Omnitrophota bacterium]
MLNARLKKLVEDFSRHKNIDALLIINDSNIRYLTQFAACESWLLVTKTKAFYITDSRYILEARQGLKGVTVKQYSQMPCATLRELCKQCKVKRLGFDERHTPYSLWKKLKEFFPRKPKLIPVTGMVEGLREVKDEGEIAQIRECLKLHFKAIDFMKKVVKPGLTERQAAQKLERFVKSHGAEFSFTPIIASGPNSCYPHARSTDRIIRNNEVVLLDFGVDLNGYKSDLTRNFFLGRIAPHVKQVFEALWLAQHEAVKLIKPGVPCAQVDLQARKVLRKFGLSQYFGHSLGHGVGLDIHESPRLSSQSTGILEPGMIVTVEPGVYIPHQFGIRVEDMVLVTKEGNEVLSGYYN